jgi:hypothetical protein
MSEKPPEKERERLWDDDGFLARVAFFAQKRGRRLSEVSRTAGLAHDYLSKKAPRSGRSTEAVYRIARSLGVSLIELIGVGETHHDALPTEETLVRLALVVDLAAHLYVALGSRRKIPSGIDTMEMVIQLLDMIEAAADTEMPSEGAN